MSQKTERTSFSRYPRLHRTYGNVKQLISNGIASNEYRLEESEKIIMNYVYSCKDVCGHHVRTAK